jgi:hypothetical protein
MVTGSDSRSRVCCYSSKLTTGILLEPYVRSLQNVLGNSLSSLKSSIYSSVTYDMNIFSSYTLMGH